MKYSLISNNSYQRNSYRLKYYISTIYTIYHPRTALSTNSTFLLPIYRLDSKYCLINFTLSTFNGNFLITALFYQPKTAILISIRDRCLVLNDPTATLLYRIYIRSYNWWGPRTINQHVYLRHAMFFIST